MKNWQKITGIIVLAGLSITGLMTWLNAFVDMKYMVEPHAGMNDDLWGLVHEYYLIVTSLSVALGISIALCIFLFICLWREKDGIKE
ncbi:hypothetical protein [Prevotella sp. KH2C16]|uniref:hypothetical protein n=1 Tax=Prevotella sp. KH2C16 TaxID=1855325 RepID=UPI0008E82151|nr:hypothetical protein [Prevotella sp. KH2C16]SFG43460.1 hypothetical protein SAMN05216383_1149 [Prevotella sp. KH2C16]